MHWRNAILAASIFLPLTAMADVTYSYTGEALNDNLSGYCTTSACEVTFDFTVSTALAASTEYGWGLDYISPAGYDAYAAIDLESWSISDGTTTQSGANTTALSQGDLVNFIVFTDSTGAIDYWLIQDFWGSDPNPTIYTTKGDGIEDWVSTSSGAGYNESSPGSWSSGSSAATPEPSSLLLLGTGLAGFAGMLKRRLAAGGRA
jgi:hypothetical protein